MITVRVRREAEADGDDRDRSGPNAAKHDLGAFESPGRRHTDSSVPDGTDSMFVALLPVTGGSAPRVSRCPRAPQDAVLPFS